MTSIFSHQLGEIRVYLEGLLLRIMKERHAHGGQQQQRETVVKTSLFETVEILSVLVSFVSLE